MKNYFWERLVTVLIGVLALTNWSMAANGSNEAGWFNNLVAQSQMDWNDVFSGGDYGEDLYLLMYDKSIDEASERALKDISANTGFTTSEAKKALDGGFGAIFNHETEGTERAEVFAKFRDLRSDYEDLKELYQLEQDIEMAVKPSELFANGDLGDSGFDLVHDLALIEEILFVEKEPTTIGGVYERRREGENERSVDSEQPAEVDLDQQAASFGFSAEDLAAGDGPEILLSDVCLEENEIRIEGENGFLPEVVEEEEVVGDEEQQPQAVARGAQILRPAMADQWLKQWCAGDNENSYQANFSSSSLGGIYDEADDAEAGDAPFVINKSLCIAIKLQLETERSYLPGDTCILCELEKINLNLDKTLSHSLVPNKVTGNLLESAKCKDTFGAGLNLQLITVWSPVPTAPNDDLVFGKNIFEEWDKFVDRYQPLLLNQLPDLYSADGKHFTPRAIAEYQLRLNNADRSQLELINEIDRISNYYTAAARLNYEKRDLGNLATNEMLYSREVLAELVDMNALFDSLLTNWRRTQTDALSPLISKPNLD